MRKLTVWAAGFFMCLQLLSVSDASAAAPRGFGLGVILGEPTGITGKVMRGGNDAIDFGLAYSWRSQLTLYADYLWQFPEWVRGTDLARARITPYLGLGAVFKARSSLAELGLRVPIGLEWMISRPPLGIFLELVPGFIFVPSTDGLFQGGLGVRYFF